jgi:hypothetical protein
MGQGARLMEATRARGRSKIGGRKAHLGCAEIPILMFRILIPKPRKILTMVCIHPLLLFFFALLAQLFQVHAGTCDTDTLNALSAFYIATDGKNWVGGLSFAVCLLVYC